MKTSIKSSGVWFEQKKRKKILI